MKANDLFDKVIADLVAAMIPYCPKSALPPLLGAIGTVIAAE